MIPRVTCVLLLVSLVACGKKGPPLAPLHLVPDVVKDVVAVRTGDEVRLRFTLPTANLAAPGPIQLDRVEIYAVTAAPDQAVPPTREFLSATYRIATLPVKPAPVEGEPPPPADPRPGPGETVHFTEPLTAAKVTPGKLPPYKPGERPAAPTVTAPPVATPAAATAAATAPQAPTSPTGTSPEAAAPDAPPVALNVIPLLTLPGPAPYPVRIYVIRGMTRSGRGGQPSARITVPLVAPPAPPAALKGSFSETALALTWTGPVQIAPATFNVYAPQGNTPINATPLSAPAFELTGVEFGIERCFVVRTVEVVGGLPIESEPSEESCVTPKDIFPPAAPQRLQVVPAPGVMNLSWQPNAEADLAGYIVLRGDAPGGTLQALTPAPITVTRFEDTTARAGSRYVYVVVAVDGATPRNTSAFSNRIEETAR